MKAMQESATSTLNSVNMTAGRLSKAGPPAQQQIEENRAAHDAHHRADGDFIGKPEQTSDNITEDNQSSTENCHPWHRPPHIITNEPAHHIRHNQTKKRDHANSDNN